MRLSFPATAVLIWLLAVDWSGMARGQDAAERGQKYALLVGVDSYPRGSLLTSLKFPGRDVEELAKVLQGAGYLERNVRVLNDARGRADRSFDPLSGNLQRELRLLLTDKREDDVVVIVLAGHGIMMTVDRTVNGQSVRRQESFFCPADADLSGARPDTLLSLDILNEQLADCPAKVKFLLCDACRNDAFLGGRPGGVELPPPIAPPRTVAALYSCAKEEVAFEDADLAGGHGVFLHFVIQGLKGQADANRDGQVTLTELAEFSQDKVRSHVAERFGRRQMPELLGSLHRVPLVKVERNEPEVPSPSSPATAATLLPSTPSATPPPASAVAVVRHDTDLMNGTQVVKSVRQGERLAAIRQNGSWIGVALAPGGQAVGGWVHQDAVTLIGSIPREGAEPAKGAITSTSSTPRSNPTSSARRSSGGTSTSSAPSEGELAGELREIVDLKIKLCWCPPGPFRMGSPASDSEAYDDEKPQVEVTHSRGFWLGQTEVTQAQWKAVMGTEPWRVRQYDPHVRVSPGSAASNVSWEDAAEFCRKLTERERAMGRLTAGQSYRLPTEAEWEYACRAGTTTIYHFGNDAGRLSEHAVWGGFASNGTAKSQKYAHEVGSKAGNAWNLYDMHGNVWEWCQDLYAARVSGGRDPFVASGGTDRVCRGGSWSDVARNCRSACRDRNAPSHRDNNVGFRIALSSSSPPGGMP